jgi:hypothetical protein
MAGAPVIVFWVKAAPAVARRARGNIVTPPVICLSAWPVLFGGALACGAHVRRVKTAPGRQAGR